jgi:two-component system sensor histidine kinase/response regulator
MHLGQIVQRVVDLFAARLDQKGLEFLVDMPPEVPRRVLGDPLRLSQVLNNLVGNAVKFTERGHVQLVVRVLPDTAGGPSDMLHFSVQDTGIGIAPERRAVLFESFAQGDSSITRRFGGTGLGLAISRRLVEMMDGRIGIGSGSSPGSEFWFTARLPRVENGASPAPSLLDVAGMRILVVDHSAVSAGVLQTQLRATTRLSI